MNLPTLGYALLALLARASGTGYELAQRLDRPIGYFWNAQYSQIHGTLAKLAAAGAVSWDAVPGPGPHEKKIYSITETGRQALGAWVTDFPRREPTRSEMLLKTYALWTADPVRATQLFTAQLAEHRERLADYEAAWKNVTQPHPDGKPPTTHPDFGNYLTLRYGIGHEQHDISWCEWVLDQLTSCT